MIIFKKLFLKKMIIFKNKNKVNTEQAEWQVNPMP